MKLRPLRWTIYRRSAVIYVLASTPSRQRRSRADVVRTVRLTAQAFGRLESSAPQAMGLRVEDQLACYLIARGRA